MAITSELIGKLGGTDIEEIPVNMSSDREAKEFVLQRVEVPSGERRIIIVDGVFTKVASATFYQPLLVVGDIKSPIASRNVSPPYSFYGGGILSQTGNVSIETINTYTGNDVAFSGTLYIASLD